MCISQKESPKPAKTHKNAGKKTTTTPQKHPPKANINETQQSTKKTANHHTHKQARQSTKKPIINHNDQQKPATTTKKTNNTLSSSQTTSHNQKHPKTRAHQPQRPTQHYTHPHKHTNPQPTPQKPPTNNTKNSKRHINKNHTTQNLTMHKRRLIQPLQKPVFTRSHPIPSKTKRTPLQLTPKTQPARCRANNCPTSTTRGEVLRCHQQLHCRQQPEPPWPLGPWHQLSTNSGAMDFAL